jgi:hypothetical protein
MKQEPSLREPLMLTKTGLKIAQAVCKYEEIVFMENKPYKIGKLSEHILLRFFKDSGAANKFFAKWHSRIGTWGAVIIYAMDCYESMYCAVNDDYFGAMVYWGHGTAYTLALLPKDVALAKQLSISGKTSAGLVIAATIALDAYYAIKFCEANTPELKEAYACKIMTVSAGGIFLAACILAIPITGGLSMVAYVGFEYGTFAITSLLAYFGFMERGYTFSELVVSTFYHWLTGHEMPNLEEVQAALDAKARGHLDTWTMHHIENNEIPLVVEMGDNIEIPKYTPMCVRDIV